MTTSTGIASYINSMDQKWRNWWIRGFFTFIMIGLFGVFIYIGPLALAVLVLGVFFKCFQEIVKIGRSKYLEYNLPLYRVLNWFFFFVFSLYLTGSNLIYYYPEYFNKGLPDMFASYFRLVCFSLYIFGFVMFVLTLQKDYYGIQFTLFGWTHITLFFIGCQYHFAIQNIYEGLFWFLLPVSMVICNDIMAYVFG
jgi:phosphatidate cytidylyltransferase